MYENLLYEVTDSVARITLNRPDVYHALSPALLRELAQAVQTAEADTRVRVLLLTATGDKAFCSGADLKAGLGEASGMGEALRTGYIPLIMALRSIPKPVVGRLNGLAVGAGCSLALACDVVLAREDAYLSLMFVQIGLMPDAGATYFLPRLVGMARAFELASTGRRVYAPEAAQLGLIHRAVPAAELDAAVEETLHYYRHAPTRAIGAMKRVLNEAYHSDLPTLLELEAQQQDELGASRDAAEGITAFLQKRKPDYQGR
ncbi:2-(1,2-epoxy-1,2-dihydrophenyl)acetyl-CoA isomerase PaaG [Rhabdobacter roseus]|uniref:2-(1,2-epoxy-1,2-dihydrophenyl)acetyl-CoA isomerase n=1 Tax=Rhabdobacter roseus TaxID=1655419 RepID=A0A840TMZ2_9BACT|nr:enoyl-CoA hydratase-related protein [Rhabdobacter roseus]MBB5285021.1 2-(1,2-epoxy-1,2-dihydrophenyl)acetyl-CoA isomerase [Rhabdobacter roseus]